MHRCLCHPRLSHPLPLSLNPNNADYIIATICRCSLGCLFSANNRTTDDAVKGSSFR